MKIILKWFIKNPEREMIINVPADLVDLGGYLKRMGISSDIDNLPDYANVISGKKKVPYFSLSWDGIRLVISDNNISNRKSENQLNTALQKAEVFPSEIRKCATTTGGIRNAINYQSEASQVCVKP